MTRLEKLELAIELGYTYDPETGKIYGIKGEEIKSKVKAGYIKIVSRKFGELLAHQFAWYWVNKEIVKQIDHINNDRADNRIFNLRSVTSEQNNWNRTKTKGYTWNKTADKWQSQIMISGKYIYLGIYDTEDDAKQAYLNAKEKFHII